MRDETVDEQALLLPRAVQQQGHKLAPLLRRHPGATFHSESERQSGVLLRFDPAQFDRVHLALAAPRQRQRRDEDVRLLQVCLAE